MDQHLEHQHQHAIQSTAATASPSTDKVKKRRGRKLKELEPGWAPAPPPANHEKRRWSCEICRSKKVKCDGTKPVCGYCHERGLGCVYLGAGIPKAVRKSKSTSANEKVDEEESKHDDREEHEEEDDGEESIAHTSGGSGIPPVNGPAINVVVDDCGGHPGTVDVNSFLNSSSFGYLTPLSTTQAIDNPVLSTQLQADSNISTPASTVDPMSLLGNLGPVTSFTELLTPSYIGELSFGAPNSASIEVTQAQPIGDDNNDFLKEIMQFLEDGANAAPITTTSLVPSPQLFIDPMFSSDSPLFSPPQTAMLRSSPTAEVTPLTASSSSTVNSLSPISQSSYTASKSPSPFPVLGDLIDVLSNSHHSFIDPTDRLSNPGARSDQLYSSATPIHPNAIRDGNVQEALALIDAFFKNEKQLMQSIVHKQTFMENLRAQPDILVLAMCAFGAKFVKHASHHKMWYYGRARSLVPEYVENPRVEAVQANLILTAFAFSIGQFSFAWTTVGLAIRMALFLRMDEDPDDCPELCQLPFITKEIRRRCFWFAYVLDGNVAYQTGRVPMIKRISELRPKVKGVCPHRAWYQATSQFTPVVTDADRLSNPMYHNLALADLMNEIIVFVRRSMKDYDAKKRPISPVLWMIDMQKFLQQTQPTSVADEAHYGALLGKLDVWISMAPCEMVFYPTREKLVEMLDIKEDLTNLPYIQGMLIYHRCICTLHYKALWLQVNRGMAFGTGHEDDKKRKWGVLESCKNSALVISKVMEVLWTEHHRDFRVVSGPVMLSSFQSSIVLALLISEAGQKALQAYSKECGMVYNKSESMAEIGKALHYNMKVINALHGDWTAAEHIQNFLEELLASYGASATFTKDGLPIIAPTLNGSSSTFALTTTPQTTTHKTLPTSKPVAPLPSNDGLPIKLEDFAGNINSLGPNWNGDIVHISKLIAALHGSGSQD
ncbi:hypothetical protein HDV05_004241 [Chytridiales sp. JEL 0842]|nr:hypothetical protein HDV05_004241 [Chytridiales sp. JEL 0842]